MLKRVPVSPGVFEIQDETGRSIVKLTPVTLDGNGSVGVTATFDDHLSRDIIEGVRLLETLRFSLRPNVADISDLPLVR